MPTISTPEKPNIDLLKPAPRPAILPGTLSDPATQTSDTDHLREVMEKHGLPESLPKPAKVVDQPKV